MSGWFVVTAGRKPGVYRGKGAARVQIVHIHLLPRITELFDLPKSR
jgi:hypothetical protein